MKNLRLSVCQINPVVGDLSGNSEKILRFYDRAVRRDRPDLVVFPECSLTGYPPEDLLLKESFLRETRKHMDALAAKLDRSWACVGSVHSRGGKVYNAAVLVRRGKIAGIYAKQSLPNYGVFDEKRYFSPGSDPGIYRVEGVPVGFSVCEDIWDGGEKVNPCVRQAQRGAKILVNLSASPYHAGKLKVRLDLLKARSRQTRCPVVYANMVGGQDELVLDGRSLALDAGGSLRALAKGFEEDILTVDFEAGSGRATVRVLQGKMETAPADVIAEIYQALVLGTRDYVEKNRFGSVVVGLSGGIDSALVAAIAVEALGPDRVTGVTMPSRFSSAATRRDARRLAQNLGIAFRSVSIEKIFKAYRETLAPLFAGRAPDITEENLQSRIRGTLLMALSNKFGHLVLTTGNKSEVSVGYCTLYGDTAGGFALLKDVPKTDVYRLSRFVNRRAGRELIPRSILERAPTAELKPNQKDQDTLPEYELLDKMIRLYVEEDRGYGEMVRKGISAGLLKKTLRMIDGNEYKRRQSPPGVKITPKAFGRDRRMPITNRFREF